MPSQPVQLYQGDWVRYRNKNVLQTPCCQTLFHVFVCFSFFPYWFQARKMKCKTAVQTKQHCCLDKDCDKCDPTHESAHKQQNTDHFVERRVVQHAHEQTETWLFTGSNRGAVGQFQNLLPEVILSHLVVPQQLVEDLQHTGHHLPLGEETLVTSTLVTSTSSLLNL